MKLLSLFLISGFLLSSCGIPAESIVVQSKPKTETNTVDIGNKTIITVTGSAVQPIR